MKNRAWIAFGAAALAFAIGAAAQRKPILAPGQEPPQRPEPSKPKEETPPVVPADERQQPDAGPAAKPATVAPPPKEPVPAPSKSATPSQAPAPPAAPPAKPGPPPPPPAELLFRHRFGPWNMVFRLKPGEPKPGHPVEVVFEVSRRLESPDPVYGDRKPLEGATLLLTAQKQRATVVIVLHPLVDAGEYGARFSLPDRGQWTLTISQPKRADEEHGETPVNGEFTIGVGEPTVMPSEATEASATAARGPLHRGTEAEPDAASLQGVMRSLGKNWVDLLGGLADTRASAKDLTALSKSVSQLAGQVKGKAPRSAAGSSTEFDLESEHFQASVADLDKNSSDRSRMRQRMSEIETANCLSCHARFFYRITDDTSQWPKFTIKQPDAPKRRRP